MSKIKEAFSHGKAFVAFITCGDPNLETTIECVKAAVEGGAALIELGIPFSDPTAEGPVIQGANIRALSNGITTDDIFKMVKELRKQVSVPMVFMTYANVVFSYGTEKFSKKCKEIGMDGVILPDVPFEEKEEFAPFFRSEGLDFVSLIAPTSENRIETIARQAEGFLYCVSSLGVTGERTSISEAAGSIAQAAKEFASVPVAIGFGISTPAQAKQMSRFADGVIVGSAIERIIGQHGVNSPKFVYEYVKSMTEAIE